ncbi:MAG: hypothetical protein R3B90_21875 [Planctomycetaceae bacterium]
MAGGQIFEGLVELVDLGSAKQRTRDWPRLDQRNRNDFNIADGFAFAADAAGDFDPAAHWRQ